jgi:hypothetical protein
VPDYFTHSISAQVIFERLENSYKRKITSKDCYLLGAQGGDVFFAYGINVKKTNLGRRIHDMSAYDLLSTLSKGDPSYVAGFATHYALDSTLHPLIYSIERTLHTPFAHMKIESELGLYISKQFGIRRQILPRERVLAQTYTIYDSIKKIDENVTVTGIERALSRHFYYTRILFNKKSQVFSLSIDEDTLLKEIENSLNRGKECVRQVLDGNLDKDTFSKSFLEK